MFGISPKVGNLTKGYVRSGQMFINKHADPLVAKNASFTLGCIL